MKSMLDIGVISTDKGVIDRVRLICEEFEFTFVSFSNLMEYLEADQPCRTVLATTNKDQTPEECSQAVKGVNSSTFVITSVDKTINKNSLPFLKKCGVDLILIYDEIFESSKLEFVFTQEVKAKYFPIKATDIVIDQELDFNIYHYISHSGKFLPCSLKGNAVSANKHKKMHEIGEIYVCRPDMAAFNKYFNNQDTVKSDIYRKCRINYLALYAGYVELVYSLTDQGEYASYDRGAALFKSCRIMCESLVSVIASVDDPWKIVDNSIIGNLGSVERATAIATYIGSFSMISNIKHDMIDTMIAALLCDVGLLYVNPSILKKMRLGQRLSEEETRAYTMHPDKSVTVILERKLALNDRLRKVIAMTHERQDGKGYPNTPLPERIPIESQLIQFCTEFDKKTQIKPGEMRIDFDIARNQLIKEHVIAGNCYVPALLEDLKTAFNEIKGVA